MKARKVMALVLALVMTVAAIPAGMLTLAPKTQAQMGFYDYTKSSNREYYYTAGTQFISEIVLWVSSDDSSNGVEYLLGAGSTPFGNSFNAGTGGKYVSAGYRTTTEPEFAIKALRIWHGADDPFYASSFLGDGVCTFLQVHEINGMVNLNSGNSGDNLRLYFTCDNEAGPAVTELGMCNHGAANYAQNTLLHDGYTIATSFQDIANPQNLNAGADGDYNYIGYRSTCIEVNSDALRAAYRVAKGCYDRGEASTELTDAMSTASAILGDFRGGYTTYTQAQIDAAADSLTAAMPAGTHVYADYPAPAATEYTYAAGTQFISQLAIACSPAPSQTATQDLEAQGFTPFGRSFNDNGKGEYVRGGYVTTTDPSHAVKFLRVWNGSGDPLITTSEFDSSIAYFYQVGSGVHSMTPGTFGTMNLNLGNDGSLLHLFVTDAPAAGPAITDLSMSIYSQGLTYDHYTIVDSFQSPGAYQDLDEGATAPDGLYLGWKSENVDPVNSSALRAAYSSMLQRYVTYGYHWVTDVLDDAAAILDDLRDGYTTYTQAQIDDAAAALNDTPTLFTVNLIIDPAATPHLHYDSSVTGNTITITTENTPIDSDIAAVRIFNFFYDDDDNLQIYLRSDVKPAGMTADEQFKFDGWSYEDGNKASSYVPVTGTTVNLYARELPLAPEPPQVPDAVTLSYSSAPTSFALRVDECANMTKQNGVNYTTEQSSFQINFHRSVLFCESNGTLNDYYLTSDAPGASMNDGSLMIAIPANTPLPFICQVDVHLSEDTLSQSPDGEFTGTLNWDYSDALNSGGGGISLSLTVQGLSAEEQAMVDHVEQLIDSIGDVTSSAASAAMIDQARSAYDALSQQLKDHVQNYDVLTQAEEDYALFSQTYIYAHSLTLDGTIGVNFYVHLPETVTTCLGMFQVGGSPQRVDSGHPVVMDGLRLYKITCRVAPAQIAATIDGEIDITRDLRKTFTYSVCEYLTELQNDPELSSNE
ncbi:MAG: hypothetical protein IK080_03565, partial [Clostridia bacterium]|nr:hypothetical protein [Clostridia bacterium]